MMNKLFKFFLVSSLLEIFLILSVYGQKDNNEVDVFLLSGDTIHGITNFNGQDKNPDIIKGMDGSNHEFSFKPGEIFGFRTHGNFYKSATIDVELGSVNQTESILIYNPHIVIKNVFIQVLVQGPKGLCLYKDQDGIDHFYLFVENEYVALIYRVYILNINGNEKRIIDNSYKKQLISYMGNFGNEKIIQNLQYREYNLLKCFEGYYSHLGDEQEFIKTSSKAKITSSLGCYTGFSVTSLTFSNPIYNLKFKNSQDVLLGLTFNLTFPGLQNRRILVNELGLSRYHFFESDKISSSTNLDVSFVFTYLKMNNLFRLYFPIGNVSFFGNVGISNGVYFKPTNHYRFYTVDGTTSEGTAYTNRHVLETGVLIGCGLKIWKLTSELRFEYGNGFSESRFYTNYTTRYALLFGYCF